MQFQIFVSHDSLDYKVAAIIKTLVESVFPSVNVFISADGLRGGDLWAGKLRERLQQANLILALVTKRSQSNLWVHFEAGAGFADEKTIPICTDGVTSSDLQAPFSLLQARNLDARGISTIIGDIASKAEYRDPSGEVATSNRIAAAVQEINQASSERDQSGTINLATSVPGAGASSLPIRIDKIDLEHVPQSENYDLFFVGLSLSNPGASGFTITSLGYSWDPDEIIVAQVSFHRELDGSVCFGFPLPSGQSVHQKRPESDAPQFPRDIRPSQSWKAVAVLAVRRKLDAPPRVAQDGFAVVFSAHDSRGTVLGRLVEKIKFPDRELE